MRRRALEVVFRLREIEKRSARSALAQSLRSEHQALTAQVNVAMEISAETSFLTQSKGKNLALSDISWFSQTQSSYVATAMVYTEMQAATRHAVASLAKSQMALRAVNIALEQHSLRQHGEMLSRHQREWLLL